VPSWSAWPWPQPQDARFPSDAVAGISVTGDGHLLGVMLHDWPKDWLNVTLVTGQQQNVDRIWLGW
jgi:hypothetical protein